MLILLQYIKWKNITQFQCHSPLHDPSTNDVMSDMLPRYKNWYIQKDLCLIHSEFSKCDRSVGRLLPFDPSTGRFNAQLEIDFFDDPCGYLCTGIKNRQQNGSPRGSFKFPAAVISVNSLSTQPFIILFRGSGLERTLLAQLLGRFFFYCNA